VRDRGVQSSPRAPSSIVLISCRPVVDLRQVAFANNLMQLALRLSSHFITPLLVKVMQGSAGRIPFTVAMMPQRFRSPHTPLAA
jgi:hypothetical protein